MSCFREQTKGKEAWHQKRPTFQFSSLPVLCSFFYQVFCPLSSGGVKRVLTTKEKLADASLRELLKGRLWPKKKTDSAKNMQLLTRMVWLTCAVRWLEIARKKYGNIICFGGPPKRWFEVEKYLSILIGTLCWPPWSTESESDAECFGRTQNMQIRLNFTYSTTSGRKRCW